MLIRYGALLLFSYEQQVVGHAQHFRLFADVKMIAQVLRVVLVAHLVDALGKQLGCAIGCNLMQKRNAAVQQQLARSIHRVKHKGKVVQAEGLLVVVAV